jgi:hypothetical protein
MTMTMIIINNAYHNYNKHIYSKLVIITEVQLSLYLKISQIPSTLNLINDVLVIIKR